MNNHDVDVAKCPNEWEKVLTGVIYGIVYDSYAYTLTVWYCAAEPEHGRYDDYVSQYSAPCDNPLFMHFLRQVIARKPNNGTIWFKPSIPGISIYIHKTGFDTSAAISNGILRIRLGYMWWDGLIDTDIDIPIHDNHPASVQSAVVDSGLVERCPMVPVFESDTTWDPLPVYQPELITCGDYLDNVTEFGNSCYRFVFTDYNAVKHTVCDMKTESGIKLFVDSRPLVLENNHFGNRRVTILGQDDDHITIDYCEKHIEWLLNRPRAVPKCSGALWRYTVIRFDGFRATDGAVEWWFDRVGVTMNYDGDVFLENWFVLNSNHSHDSWLKDVWLVSDTGRLIHTNIPWDAIYKHMMSDLKMG